jgi:hypothetical protein
LATYQFVGQCGDCVGTGIGRLTLQNYTPGQALTWANFVSFTYTSNINPIPAGITPSTPNYSSSSYLSGTIPANLPGPAAVILGYNSYNWVLQTTTGATGYWCVGANACDGDWGNGSVWSLVGASSPTPVAVPALGHPMLIGLAVLLALFGATILRKGLTGQASA